MAKGIHQTCFCCSLESGVLDVVYVRFVCGNIIEQRILVSRGRLAFSTAVRNELTSATDKMRNESLRHAASIEKENKMGEVFLLPSD
jgi:hypothetical protein